MVIQKYKTEIGAVSKSIFYMLCSVFNGLSYNILSIVCYPMISVSYA